VVLSPVDVLVKGNFFINIIQNSLSQCDEDTKLLFTQIVTKDLKIGITATTINKIFGEEKYKVVNSDIANGLIVL
jgi:hypothetical protein